MKIESVRIRNFRALKDVSIVFDSVTTLIGPNGSGKSTVLRALDWFFNGKAGSISEEDCSFGASDEEIEVQVTFTDLTAKDREELGKYTPPGATNFTAWKRRSRDGSEVLSANSKSYREFNTIREKGTASERKLAYNALRSSDPTLELPAWTNDAAAIQAMTAWETRNTDRLVDAPESLQTNFFGFNSGGKMSGLFDFVLVTADLRASEESVDGKSSIIGRILERSVDRSAADEEIATIVEESLARQQTVYEEKFKAQLEAMTNQLNSVITTYSPGRTVSVTPAEMQLKAPRTTFDVSVIDGTTETKVERQGHGFQRTLLISSLQVLAQSGVASTEGVICLAIEEPELFQHPVQAQAFAKVLRALAEDKEKHIQVTYATHSPYFLEARHFDQVRRLVRSIDAMPVVTVHSANVDGVRARVAGVMDSAKVERQLDGFVTNELSVALFANRALLVEGTTDLSVMYGIADRDGIGSLEASGISIVPVGGKTSLPLAHAILDAMGIPVYVLFDSDSGSERRAKANGALPEKIREQREKDAKENRKLLGYFGLPEEDFPTGVVADGVSIFDDRLEEFLSENWPEWTTSCRKVEAAAGMSLGKNQLAYRVATLEAKGTVPKMLTEVLIKARGSATGVTTS